MPRVAITGRRQSCLAEDRACSIRLHFAAPAFAAYFSLNIATYRRTDVLQIVLRATLIAAMMRMPQVSTTLSVVFKTSDKRECNEKMAVFRGRRWDRS
jgi:hypothetical protein